MSGKLLVLVNIPLQWRHNGRDGVWSRQPHHCLLNRLFGRRSKKTSKLRVTGLCVVNSPVNGEFPTQMASNAKNVSSWWRHHVPIWKQAADITWGELTPAVIFIPQEMETQSNVDISGNVSKILHEFWMSSYRNWIWLKFITHSPPISHIA